MSIKDINDLSAILPDFLKVTFEKSSEAKETNAAPIVGNGGMLSAIYDEVEEPVEEVEVAPAEPVRIEPGIHSQKRDELAVFKKNSLIEVTLRCAGYEYHGKLTGAAAAEGAFTSFPEDQDRAFNSLIFNAAVQEMRSLDPVENGLGYSACATALWTNREREGDPAPRAFIVMFWKWLGHTQYPSEAILFDGDRQRVFKMERTDQKNPRAPLWKGWAE